MAKAMGFRLANAANSGWFTGSPAFKGVKLQKVKTGWRLSYRLKLFALF